MARIVDSEALLQIVSINGYRALRADSGWYYFEYVIFKFVV